MFAIQRILNATERAWNWAGVILGGFSLARAAVALSIMVTAISILPMAALAGITAFLAWGFLLVRTAVIYAQVGVQSVFDFFFAKLSYPRLSTVDHRCPPTYDEWCAIVDASLGDPYPKFPPLPTYMQDFPRDDESGSSSSSEPPFPGDDIKLRHRNSTSAASVPRLHSRLNQLSARETTEEKDYGFPVSPENSVIDTEGGTVVNGVWGQWDPWTAYYARVSERRTRGRDKAWWEV
jgi:hypothetical protein